ncbi:MAG: MurT ligase domain-containing protein [Patescibacteria group bacterium]|jgi:UDP-N-acetylmuramyl tripeptide synthase
MVYNVDMFGLCVIISKVANLLINTLKLGAGYTWPGHIALTLYPSILKSPRIRFTKGLILLSGTNGKTTTSKLLAHILNGASFKIVSNTSGANLKNGVVSSILLSSSLKSLAVDYGVFEVDEFALSEVLKDLTPNVLILLNLSRDQLDRYGETDIILEKWKKSLSELSASTVVVVDEDQLEIRELCRSYSGKVDYFGSDNSYLKNTALKGMFNARNINAAVLACKNLGLAEEDILPALKTFKPAYGRGEKIGYLGKNYHILLAKNPASFNYNLDAIKTSEFDFSTLLLVLNDNIPDGRDVSWIYDIDPVSLRETFKGKNIYFAGSRSKDMALRLKHSGVSFSEEHTFGNLKDAFAALSKIDADEILVLPNYSAMLDVRDFLIGRKIL